MGNMYYNGVMGVVVGDALGEPVQFESRATVATHPVTDMRGYGTFNLPEGSWTDDSSLTLALLDSLNRNVGVELKDIADNFVKWLEHGEFTPYGFSYDIGRGTMLAIRAYERSGEPLSGGTEESNNGDGSLMRILPICIRCVEVGISDIDAINYVHQVSALTHGHMRAMMACGLYYFMVKEVITGKGSLIERMQKGLNMGFVVYKVSPELKHYMRVVDLKSFAETPVNQIKSSGYVVDAFEAAVWSLVTTSSYKEALLKAVNLGLDTDTVGAIAGGIAGLYYGIGGEKGIPVEWIAKVKRNEWIKEMCMIADERSEK